MKKCLKKIAIKLYFGNSFFRKKVHFGKNSYILKNPQIGGGNSIFLGENTRIGPNARLQCFKQISGEKLEPCIKISDNVIIGRNVTISCCNSVIIMKNTMITGYVFIGDSNHGMDVESELRYEQQKMIKKEIIIGENVFIGEKAIILPGVKIGNNTIIGAGSVVTKSFGDNVMIAGNPAKIIKKYDFELHKWLDFN